MTDFFDSHGGATLDGTWLDGRSGVTVQTLAADLRAAGFFGGLVQGLPGVGGYEHRRFASAVLEEPGMLPVAGWGHDDTPSPRTMQTLRDLGFVGIHVHPRLSGICPGMPAFRTLLKSAASAGFPVFLCTYQFAPAAMRLPVDPLPALAADLAEAPGSRLVLLHGGSVELLRWSEFVRANPDTLLDLSFTLMRYAGTRIDSDIEYVLRTLDRRTCFGTDAPEYASSDVATRISTLLDVLPGDKRANVAHASLLGFLRLDRNRIRERR